MAKKCKICEKEFVPKFKTTERHCSIECFKQDKKPNLKLKSIKKINQVSDKRKLEDIIYKSERIKFLSLPENKKCPVTGKPTTDIHHMKGRIGSLLLDTRYWVALSREGHKYVEENPEWAKENGYSLNRLI